MSLLGKAVLPVLFAGSIAAQTVRIYTAEVQPVPGETFQAPCRFELTLPSDESAARAVWVVYDRGRETRELYDDEALFRFAERRRLALLWARHCPGEESGDIDPHPAHGLGRALLSSLDQFARVSKHPELSTAKTVLLGFDSAGPLVARLPQFAPNRVLASIVYAANGMDGVQLSPTALSVPQLVIANSADSVAGTQPSFEYFKKHFAEGGPWVFVIQNGVPHEGGLSNAKELMFEWIEMLLETTPDTTSPVALVQRTGWWLYVQIEDTGLRDVNGHPVARAKDAKTGKVGAAAPAGYAAAGWVPSKKAAGAWHGFTRKQSHPANPKY